MQIDNPIRMVRELKGAPLSIVLVLQIVRQRVTQEFLERATGYTDKPVSQALEYLREVGLVDHTREGWLLCQAQQLPLGLELSADTDQTDNTDQELSESEKQEVDQNGVSRNNSDSVAAAALNNLSLSSLSNLSCCSSPEGRKNSDSELVRAILVGEGIGPPMLERLAGGGLDPLWVFAHVLRWRREGKSRGILITRLRCGDKIGFERRAVEDELAEAFPDFYEWDDDDDGT